MATTLKRTLLAAALLMGCLAAPTLAQNAGGGAPPAGGDTGQAGGRGNRGGDNAGGGMADWRQRMADRMKTQLGMTDEEFKAIQPQIEKVGQLQRDVSMRTFGRGGFGGGTGGRGNRGGDNAPAAGAGGTAATPAEPAPSAVALKVRDLQDMLENKDAKPEEIKAKLDALRAAKAQAKEELVKAQASLRELLTQRQEAVLVTMGMLD